MDFFWSQLEILCLLPPNHACCARSINLSAFLSTAFVLPEMQFFSPTSPKISKLSSIPPVPALASGNRSPHNVCFFISPPHDHGNFSVKKILEFGNTYFTIAVDHYTDVYELDQLSSTQSSTVINHNKEHFSRHSIPVRCVAQKVWVSCPCVFLLRINLSLFSFLFFSFNMLSPSFLYYSHVYLVWSCPMPNEVYVK